MTLRPYQQDAFDAAIEWIRRCIDPCLIEAATGSGKSHLVAAIAAEIHRMSGKKILCIAPSSELVEQNYEKYRATGAKASIFSASLKKWEMRHPVIFGTPQTVSNQVARFNSKFAAVIIDEAHGVTPTLLKIIGHMQGQNPKLRVVGMSATPYRLGTGYIYANHYRLGTMDDAIDPFFHTLVHSIGGRELIDDGYLTPPVFDAPAEHYDTSGLEQQSNGHWKSATVDQAFVGHGRKTSAIVADVVERSRYRQGVMIFAATVQHAEEVMASLPPSISAIVTSGTKPSERRQILADFKARRIKYLVNVSVLTTGFDAPHVDVIAILRATESVALLQQIIGRGLRLCEGKRDCLILDYAENIERHCPGGDVFDPTIVAKVATKGEPMEVSCPWCHHVNEFGARKNDEGYGVNSEGYFTDLAGNVIEVADGKPFPAHYGRRCQGEVLVGGRHVQCGYKWSFKECHECQAENDIAARYCTSCRAEIVNPNDKLKEIAAKIANDPYRLRLAEINGWQASEHISSSGADMVRVNYHIDEPPHTLVDYIAPEHPSAWMRDKAKAWCIKVLGEPMRDNQAILDAFNEAEPPSQIAFRKKQGSKFFEIVGVE